MKAGIFNFEHEALANLKKDMEQTLRETLRTMYEKNCDTASLTIKLVIELEDDYAPDPSISSHHAEREVVVPKIEHKVTSTMNIKTERKGKTGGDGFELVKDEKGNYILKPIGASQIDIFDADVDVEDAGELNELPEIEVSMEEDDSDAD